MPIYSICIEQGFLSLYTGVTPPNSVKFDSLHYLLKILKKFIISQSIAHFSTFNSFLCMLRNCVHLIGNVRISDLGDCYHKIKADVCIKLKLYLDRF